MLHRSGNVARGVVTIVVLVIAMFLPAIAGILLGFILIESLNGIREELAFANDQKSRMAARSVAQGGVDDAE